MIRLEDARGCWRLAPVAEVEQDLTNPKAVRLRHQTWWTLVFFEVDPGQLVFRSFDPAIGPRGAVFSRRLHLPDGWNAPEDRI